MILMKEHLLLIKQTAVVTKTICTQVINYFQKLKNAIDFQYISYTDNKRFFLFFKIIFSLNYVKNN